MGQSKNNSSNGKSFSTYLFNFSQAWNWWSSSIIVDLKSAVIYLWHVFFGWTQYIAQFPAKSHNM